MKIKVLSLVIGFTLLALGAGATGWMYMRDRNYTAAKPRRGAIDEVIYGLGKVKSDQRFEVKLGVLSTVKKVFVQEGQAVRKGDKLIEFDSKALFRAPIDGTVTLIANYAGETVLPQLCILRLEDLTDRYIELSLEQEGALRVRKGQSAKVSFETLRGEVLAGQVTALFSRNDEFLAHIQVSNLAPSILPGMTADVSVEVGRIDDTLLVPLRALSGGSVLVRGRDGRRRKVKLEVGHVDSQWAEVKEGVLLEDDEILVPRSRD